MVYNAHMRNTFADDINGLFNHRRVNIAKLAPFGFVKDGECYVYSQTLADSGFVLTVRVTGAGEVYCDIIDPEFGEPYTLHLACGASGSFVGRIREERDCILTEVARRCFDVEVFKSDQTMALIDHARSTYGNELEFLWKNLPDNAILRRKDTSKWYAVMLPLSKRKLGLNCDDAVEILDLRSQPEKLSTLVDCAKYFPGYHMNKAHWYTIMLDGSVDLSEIFDRLHESYLLATRR